jgi:hypothetical protein
MKEFKPEDLTKEQIRLCHNLYNKNWRASHKDSVRCTNTEYYKKRKGIKKEFVPGSVKVMDIFGNR